jgi:hypothetical protein
MAKTFMIEAHCGGPMESRLLLESLLSIPDYDSVNLAVGIREFRRDLKTVLPIVRQFLLLEVQQQGGRSGAEFQITYVAKGIHSSFNTLTKILDPTFEIPRGRYARIEIYSAVSHILLFLETYGSKDPQIKALSVSAAAVCNEVRALQNQFDRQTTLIYPAVHRNIPRKDKMKMPSEFWLAAIERRETPREAYQEQMKFDEDTDIVAERILAIRAIPSNPKKGPAKGHAGLLELFGDASCYGGQFSVEVRVAGDPYRNSRVAVRCIYEEYPGMYGGYHRRGRRWMVGQTDYVEFELDCPSSRVAYCLVQNLNVPAYGFLELVPIVQGRELQSITLPVVRRRGYTSIYDLVKFRPEKLYEECISVQQAVL